MIIFNTYNLGISNKFPNSTLDVGSSNASHNIGSKIWTAGDIHTADKLDSWSIER